MPVYACALVLGSGAAGCRAAVELKRYGIDVVVATQNLCGGTSACSGSHKQTLHTAAAGRHGDDFIALRAALGAGGAMDEDTAYVEAVGSLRRCRRYNISDCRSRSTGWVQCSGIKRIMTKPGARRVADPAPLD